MEDDGVYELLIDTKKGILQYWDRQVQNDRFKTELNVVFNSRDKHCAVTVLAVNLVN